MQIKNLRGEVIKEIEGDTLRGANLVGANLHNASLRGASLDGASLVGANLVGANLHNASLVGASLVGANLVGASLVGANLHNASLDGASLVGASLVGASLVGANLHNASLRGAKWGDEKILAVYSFTGLGSARRMTTALVTDKNTLIWCGCFSGSLAEFEAKVMKEYGEERGRHWFEYSGIIRLIKELEEELRK